MPRPERSLDPAAGPVQLLAAELRDLRRQAGNPGYRALAAASGYSVAALSNAAGGRQLPSLPVTLAFVRACGGDESAWEERWRQASAAQRQERASGERPPYLGLISYGADDADRLFGRERIVTRLRETLERHRFVAVFGASGSGKSSLVRAGLIPAWRRDHAGAGPVTVITPGAEPHKALRRALDPAPALLVVDQFEELFTLCADPAERDAFITELAAAAEPGPPPAEPDSGASAADRRIVIAVRADFYARCAESAPLAGLLAGANVPVGPLTPDELREVITEPARRAGLSAERALVTQIVADAEGQPGALPLMSHALLETWRHRRGDVLTVAGYQAAGGMSGAIAQTAESVYQQLTPPERETAREVLTRLVTLGEGVPDTRRRVPRDELDQPAAGTVLGALAAARLLVLDADTVEIAHEALITAWPRLDDWLHGSRDDLRLHRRLTEASRAWRSHHRDSGALYRGAPLAAWDGRDLQRLNALEREFLTASRDRRTREATARRRRQRLTLTALTAGVVVMTVLAAVAAVQASRAHQQRDLARSHQLVANAAAQAGVDQEVALLLAIEAYDTQPTAQAQAALRQAVTDSRVRAVVPTGHGQVLDVAYRPDGAVVASAGVDGTVRLWRRDGADGLDATPQVVPSGGVAINDVAFSPDGRWLVMGSAAGLVSVLGIASGTTRMLRSPIGDSVHAVAFSPDGRRVAAAVGDGTVRIWDVTGRPLATLKLGSPALGVAFSPDSTRVAAAGTGIIRIWNASGLGTPRTLTGHEGAVKKVDFSPDGRLLASAGDDGTVRIWPAVGAGDPVILRGNDSSVETVTFSPDSRRVASSHSGSNTIRIWSVLGDQDPVVLRGHDGAVWSLAFSPGGRRLASSSTDGTLRFWDPAVAADPLVLRGHRGPVWSVDADAAGRVLAAAGSDGTVRVWRHPWTAAPTVLRGSEGEVSAVAVSPDGRLVAGGGTDRTVRVWNARTGDLRAALAGHSGAVSGVAFSPDSELVLSAGHDGTTRIWSLAGDLSRILQGHRGGIGGLALSPDGRRVASAGGDGTVHVRNADGTGTPTVIQDQPPGRQVWSVAFSPDGSRVAASGQDGAVRIWPADGHGSPVSLHGHRDTVWSVAFSPDGRLLASSGQDGDGVRIWEARTGQELVTVRGHGSTATQADFLPDGRLVTAHRDGTVRIWQCRVCGPIAGVRAEAGTLVTRTLSAAERETFRLPPR
ncbi:putative regulatory protein [Actinoplanes missouriensis 431]|uniref:Putative regulatory protein n=1 Tax=Actinoplanes missouriensis (strain ATCC 14538 / DSM 43046 / CBS 188.64 / JCM 3121 / NBRC 102363 / NCIMB 12654 / NRRL B-3342 / UNCC 431) TaxID=512565 RepID=I0H5S1_ACTM4|nr:putative regulatory protein [Actinoplanes missouriensis]BAL88358.1 putative regulatory protein [Actinoplanes missouriensis 431]